MKTALMSLLFALTTVGTSAGSAADSAVTVALVQGKPVASFVLGDSNCELREDQIRCSPATR